MFAPLLSIPLTMLMCSALLRGSPHAGVTVPATTSPPAVVDSTDSLLAVMKSDLRNIATAEEAYASNYGSYMPTTANVTHTNPVVNTDKVVYFAPSAGVTITVTNTAPGWSATATHALLPGKICSIFYQTPNAVSPATREGQPTCN